VIGLLHTDEHLIARLRGTTDTRVVPAGDYVLTYRRDGITIHEPRRTGLHAVAGPLRTRKPARKRKVERISLQSDIRIEFSVGREFEDGLCFELRAGRGR
jgi:hypothetical protein